MRVKYLDVLKAIAIVAIVLYHAGLLTFGYLGVDVFLVIAGYLTTRSLFPKLMTSGELTGGGRFYVNFELSRIIRLLPLVLVAGSICMALGYYLMLPDDYENLSQGVIASNLCANNILAYFTTKDYWDVVNEYKPLMHTWYVGLLMQFYIVYPILFFAARFNRANQRRSFLVIVGALAVLSLLYYFGTTDSSGRFYLLPARFFEFAVGGIAATIYSPQDDKPFSKGFVYVAYVVLLLLMIVNAEVLPSKIRLVSVVALTVVLLCSQHALENRVTGNVVLAKIGSASYSIFIWHQVLLAFYRYSITAHFTIFSYIVLLAATGLLSWLTFRFIEKKTNSALKSKSGRGFIYSTTLALFLLLTSCSVFIYRHDGVVRDVPELYVSKGENVSHKLYNDRIYNFDKPFETDKKHWLVVGNSTGRDFVNVILESDVSDSVEVTYIYTDSFAKPEYAERFATSDRVFLSSLFAEEELITKMEVVCAANGLDRRKLVIVGDKSFGENNGQFYINRHKPDYFEQRTHLRDGFYERNERLRAKYGDRYLDLISLVIDDNKTVPVFTPDHHYISQDCVHFSKGGAIWFSQLIDFKEYLNN